MMRIAALLVAAIFVAGCAPVNLDQVMGRATEGTPVTETQKLDCDLIFPGPDSR